MRYGCFSLINHMNYWDIYLYSLTLSALEGFLFNVNVQEEKIFILTAGSCLYIPLGICMDELYIR